MSTESLSAPSTFEKIVYLLQKLFACFFSHFSHYLDVSEIELDESSKIVALQATPLKACHLHCRRPLTYYDITVEYE